MARFGLIGKSLSHSFSKNYFSKLFEANQWPHSYDNLEFEDRTQLSSMLPGLMNQYAGFNFTIPYKKEVLSLLDSLDCHAQAIGAVNCIQIKNGQSIGFNTDYIGFVWSIKPLLDPQVPYRALVLGSGGASLAVQYGLAQLNIPFQIVSSSDSALLSYEKLSPTLVAESLLIINTTPLGMYPLVSDFPNIPYTALTPNHVVMDLIYNPIETVFLANAATQGAKTLNGYEMLRIQAEESWKIWNK